MENNFDNVMSKKTNEELINIVKVDFNKYQSAAIESANKEIILSNIRKNILIFVFFHIPVKLIS